MDPFFREAASYQGTRAETSADLSASPEPASGSGSARTHAGMPVSSARLALENVQPDSNLLLAAQNMETIG